MLISLLVPKVVATIDSIITGAFSGILFNFFYYNPSSNYITTPYRSTTVNILIGEVYRYRIVNNIIITSRVVA